MEALVNDSLLASEPLLKLGHQEKRACGFSIQIARNFMLNLFMKRRKIAPVFATSDMVSGVVTQITGEKVIPAICDVVSRLVGVIDF